jgi:23S rRNA (cytidine1920-2'-O)/16S rRNA (cytidine1409-2'-O)-methyltransferase
VVRDPTVHRDVLLRFGADARSSGFGTAGLLRSPLAGTDGNVEFLALLTAPPGMAPAAWSTRADAVAQASA